MSQLIAECSATFISDPWDDRDTTTYDLHELAKVRKDSRKGRQRVMSDHLEFEDWRAPYTDIEDAVLTTVRGISAGHFLRLRAKGKPYQFGILKGGSYFEGDLPFAVRRRSVRGFTWQKLLLRLLIFAAFIAYLFWSRSR